MADGRQGQPALRRTLRYPNLVVFGVVYTAPVGAFTLFGFTYANSGGAVVPAYVLGAIGVAFTGLSYGVMAQTDPSAGSVYRYARLALGGLAGFLGGWAIILDYVLITVLCCMFGAIFLNAAIPGIPTNVAIALSGAFATAINTLGIPWSTKVDLATAGLQLLLVTVFVVAALVLLGGTGDFAPAPLWPQGVSLSLVVAGASTALIGFLGFDAISMLAEEVDHPQPGHLIGRASIGAIGVMMVVLALGGWLLGSLAGGLVFDDPSQSSFIVIAERMDWLSLPLGLVAALALGVGIKWKVQRV